MPQHEPEVAKSRELELPRHPQGWNCRECKAYLRSNEYKAYILPDGMSLPEGVARANIPLDILANAKTTLESFCTFNPKWERVSAVHFCQHFPTVTR